MKTGYIVRVLNMGEYMGISLYEYKNKGILYGYMTI